MLISTLTTFHGFFFFLQIFRRFEYPAELSRLTRLNDTLQTGRLELLAAVFNGQNFTEVDEKLLEYESLLREAFAAGLPLVRQGSGVPQVKWTILKAVFFSSTVLTTIGKHQTVFVFLKKNKEPNAFF